MVLCRFTPLLLLLLSVHLQLFSFRIIGSHSHKNNNMGKRGCRTEQPPVDIRQRHFVLNAIDVPFGKPDLRKQLRRTMRKTLVGGVPRTIETNPYIGHLTTAVYIHGRFDTEGEKLETDFVMDVSEVCGDHIAKTTLKALDGDSGLELPSVQAPEMTPFLTYLDQRLRLGEQTTLNDVLKQYVVGQHELAMKRSRFLRDSKEVMASFGKVLQATTDEEFLAARKSHREFEAAEWSRAEASGHDFPMEWSEQHVDFSVQL